MKRISFIITILIFIFVCGFYLERSAYFLPLKVKLQDQTIPSADLNFGKVGQIMEKLGIKYAIPNDFYGLFDKTTGNFDIDNIIKLDTRGLANSDGWDAPGNLISSKIPSSINLNDDIIKTGLPILSIVVAEKDLYDFETGIFANYKERGRRWERPGFISYYEYGRLHFATGVGIRVHGQKKETALRLYFRDMYGINQFKPGILFSVNSEPIKHLVIHDDTRKFHFINPLAYDIARRIGCYAPETKPVKLFLNGRPYCEKFSMSLTEHLSKEYLNAHLGHNDFIFFRNKGRKDEPIEYKNLLKWVNDRNVKMTMEEVKKNVDLDNLVYWWISQFFCANTDIYQGLAVLDKTKNDEKWYWINWDMDHSFRNKYESKDIDLWEQKQIFKDLRTRNYEQRPRAKLFQRLINEDTEFIRYFEQKVMISLNHLLTDDFLSERLNYYQSVASKFKIPDSLQGFDQIRKFLSFRPSFFRKLMTKYFSSSESYRCSIKIPTNFNYMVDGFDKNNDYEGWYFKGAKIIFEFKNNNDRENYHIFINGKPFDSPEIIYTHEIKSNTNIKLVNKVDRDKG